MVHQIRNSLKYVSWRDRKEFAANLKAVYTAVNREAGELALLGVAEKWNKQYPMAVKCWENDWEDLATFFDFPLEIRRLIYTTNSVELRPYRVLAKRVIKQPYSCGKGVCSMPHSMTERPERTIVWHQQGRTEAPSSRWASQNNPDMVKAKLPESQNRAIFAVNG